MTTESLLLLITAIASILNLVLLIRARLEKPLAQPENEPQQDSAEMDSAYEAIEQLKKEQDKNEQPEVVFSALRFMLDE